MNHLKGMWRGFLGLLLALVAPPIVDSTTYLEDAKNIYGAIQDQVSTLPATMNLFGDGSKLGQPVNNIGMRGYTFLARLGANWKLGFRKEGVTGVGTAGNQGMKQATVSLKYAYVPITITGQAENLTKGNAKAFMQAKAMEAKFDMKDIVSHVNVIVTGCQRGGELARVSASAANQFTCDNAGNLPGAIYVRVGQTVDARPVGGGVASLDSAVVTAVNYATRVVTHDNAAAATVGHAIALEDEYPAAGADFPMTCEGLVSLVSDTGAIQGIDPAVAGQTTWKSFKSDAGAVQVSSQMIHELRQMVANRGGEAVDLFLFPSAQINQLVAIATQNIRFDLDNHSKVGKKAVDLGFQVFEYAGIPIVEDKDLLPDRIYALNSDAMKKFEAIPLSMAEDEAGSWTRVSGASGIADAVQGLLRWYIQIGTTQRSALGVKYNLTIPAGFQNVPPTL